MAKFGRSKLDDITARQLEEQLYEAVLNELRRGIRREGLWTKAFAKSEGNEHVARAIYIELRVQALLDEIELAKHRPPPKSPADIEADIERERCIKALAEMGYRAIQKATGWEISEPLGGRQKINNLNELTLYTNERIARRQAER